MLEIGIKYTGVLCCFHFVCFCKCSLFAGDIPNVIVSDTHGNGHIITINGHQDNTFFSLQMFLFSHYFCSCAIYKKKCTLN